MTARGIRNKIGRSSCRWMTSCLAVLAVVVASAGTSSAETLMMPDRDMLAGTAEVVWGVTTQANGTPFTLDFGDGSAVVAVQVESR